jgi:hypothetical protein
MNPDVISAEAVQSHNLRCMEECFYRTFVANPRGTDQSRPIVGVSTGKRVWINLRRPVE